ncbi:FG-GAP-like repeat-containing protein [Streptomyces coelicoflavus]|uniref:FG-GAP-like repeat-containing protein n=1 Tax=Streptomyces coelicoflavus TaxID=285562 RepID=UPI003F4A301B
MADLNGDGAADRVSAPSPPGDGLTLTFGAEDGRVTKVRPRDLVGHDAQDAADVLAIVADFDRDGWNDLFVVATPESGGDDPRPPRRLRTAARALLGARTRPERSPCFSE